MYSNSQSVRHPAQTLSLNNQYIPPPYDFPGYHHVPGVGDPSTSGWNSVYAPREEYPYSFPGSSPSAGQVSFSSTDMCGTPTAAGGGSFTQYNFISGQDSFSSRRRPHESVRPSVSGVKTRTKDKYRVVYTDQQRLELEKEFQCNRYITMRRKSELSLALGLSERQLVKATAECNKVILRKKEITNLKVKIWFQNRRAKERKINKKKLQHSQQASTTTPTPSTLGGSADTHITTCTISEEY